ncbi:hypothetical protein PR202_ga09091 [Eleusine coracana subsp. coracana]|uniref:Homeobox domain-containing protein n=1 Tax=Eleusine coracana subsp. coracana TaxID=191504 RepID=A0AAV5C2W1_ELECO|nr:hypothetical protein QOZ80_1AG0039390 [Eleusine coracana subsp. coracana]GJM92606.1 hypothetical protein PR202_ga09091 [Eleusine coracana subsp. coracana]
MAEMAQAAAGGVVAHQQAGHQGGVEPAALLAPAAVLQVESPPLSPATAAAAANARWSPSKEQVAVLEGLYDHGLRSPTADQIQHITGRLRDHGPVEAKNVFYWFQNHKARSRQKEKQDSFAYFTRWLRRPPPLPVIAAGRVPAQTLMTTLATPQPPVAAAAACNTNGGAAHHVMHKVPYYMPAPPPQSSSMANAAHYYNLQQQAAAYHKAVVYPRMGIPHDMQQMNPAIMYQQAAPYGTMSKPLHVVTSANGGASADHHHAAGRTRETLELFPLHPTFLLPENKSRAASVLTSTSTPSTAFASFSGGESTESPGSSNSNAEALPFYDFLGLQSAGR